jgi:hypothetical protein
MLKGNSMVNTSEIEGVKVTVEIEAGDTLAVLLKSMHVAGPGEPVSARLKEQARTIVEGIDYLGGEFALIEVDGIASAVQIRSRKPVDSRYVEVILRGGNVITVEGKGGPVHVSRSNLEALTKTLVDLVK